MSPVPAKTLAAPLLGTGVLMAVYLLLRPYGDQAGPTTLSAAEAFASWRWVAAHVAGLLAIASFGRLTARLHLHLSSTLTRAARTLGLPGVVLVLPYYGAETFALHAIGRRALSVDSSTLELVPQIRDDTVAVTMFALGLLLLAVAAVLAAVAWQRASGWAAWPLAVMVAGILPQFFLPAAGRMAFGVLYGAAAGVLLIAALRGAPGDSAVSERLAPSR
jgi:hypothetical protein